MPFFAWLMFRLTSHWKQFRISGSSRIGNDLPVQAHPALDNSITCSFYLNIATIDGLKERIDETTRQRVGQTQLGDNGVRRFRRVRGPGDHSTCASHHAVHLRWHARCFPLCGASPSHRWGPLYGTTWGGGAKNAGTVFKITPAGILTTLYSFCSQTNCTDGAEPEAGLFQAANGHKFCSIPDIGQTTKWHWA